MKSKLVAFAILFCVVLTMFAEGTLFPKIKFKNNTLDVGIVTLDSLRHTVTCEFRNVGNAPLRLFKAKVSCSCLTVDLPQDSILPDSMGVLNVTYDASEKTEPENIYKSIYIYTNCEDNLVPLYVKGVYTARHDSVMVDE